jgi:hypothetical protein
MPKYNTLERKIATRISRQKSVVVLRKDFDDLGGYDQVGRALRQLVAKGVIMKIGYGLYARTEPSYFNPGERVPEKPLFPDLAREALTRLGVEIVPSTLQRQYMEGKHNQVLNGRLFGTTSRITRRIGYDGFYTSYERFAR